jgi:hypothetical protein
MERTHLTDTAVDQFPGADDTLDYWDALETQSVTTNNDALHGLILVADGDEGLLKTYPERVARARALGWMPADSETPKSGDSATLGLLAVAGCHILDIPGGLSMAIWGKTPRYSLKELVHISVLPGIGEHEALSGAEFIAYIDALEQRQRVDAAWKRRLSPDNKAQEPFTEPTAPSQSAADATSASESEPTSTTGVANDNADEAPTPAQPESAPDKTKQEGNL